MKEIGTRLGMTIGKTSLSYQEIWQTTKNMYFTECRNRVQSIYTQNRMRLSTNGDGNVRKRIERSQKREKRR